MIDSYDTVMLRKEEGVAREKRQENVARHAWDSSKTTKLK
jgi:hypothetical protein